MARAPAPRSRRSKSEVQSEFEKISDETLSLKDALDSKSESAATYREAQIRSATASVSVESVAQNISALSIDISKALTDVSNQLVSEVNQLTQLREAVALEKKELERLHQIDVASTAIGHLVEEYQNQRKQLEAELVSQRTAWIEEKQTAAREQKELDEAAKKQRAREADDFEYKRALERKKAQDTYEESFRVQQKQNLDKQQALEKSWAEREDNLKVREREVSELRAQVDAFPARLKEEKERATTEATASIRAVYEQQITLLKKDAENDRKLSEMRIQSLESGSVHQTTQIELLSKQLEDAKRQVQDIAIKAIEGASGAKALAHINQIAMEQAKTRVGQS